MLSNAADHIFCSVSLILMCVQNCDRFKIPLLPKVKKITQDLEFDEMAMTQVTKSLTGTLMSFINPLSDLVRAIVSENHDLDEIEAT